VRLADRLEWLLWQRSIYIAIRELKVVIRAENWRSVCDVGSIGRECWLIVPLRSNRQSSEYMDIRRQRTVSNMSLESVHADVVGGAVASEFKAEEVPFALAGPTIGRREV